VTFLFLFWLDKYIICTFYYIFITNFSFIFNSHQMWHFFTKCDIFSPNVPNYSLYKIYNICNICYYINHKKKYYSPNVTFSRGGGIKKRVHMRNLFYWSIFPSILVQDQYCKKRTNKYQLLKLQCIIPKGIAEKRFCYDEKNTQSK